MCVIFNTCHPVTVMNFFFQIGRVDNFCVNFSAPRCVLVKGTDIFEAMSHIFPSIGNIVSSNFKIYSLIYSLQIHRNSSP